MLSNPEAPLTPWIPLHCIQATAAIRWKYSQGFAITLPVQHNDAPIGLQGAFFSRVLGSITDLVRLDFLSSILINMRTASTTTTAKRAMIIAVHSIMHSKKKESEYAHEH